MQYEVFGEKVHNLDEFSRILSNVDNVDGVLLSELDRLYAEWKSEDDFYFFLEEECETEIPALKAASDEVEFFKCLLGAKYRGVSLLSARDEKRRKESLLEEQRKAKRLAEKQEEERRKAEMAKPRGVQLWKDGPYWADRNIGAENPWDSGYYFWWGDTIGYERKNDRWVASDGSNFNFSFEVKGIKDLSTKAELRYLGWITPDGVLSSVHDAAHKHWGGGWRMPTKADIENLENKCDWQWTRMNGVEGYAVRGRGKYASKSIFFPAAGRGDCTSLDHSGSNGYYWSSGPFSDHYGAWDLNFGSNYHCTDYSFLGRLRGKSVRPVLGFTK